MWIIFAFVSAALLGLYDVAKKRSLQSNAVLPVLMINTVLCAILFMPFLIWHSKTSDAVMVYGDLRAHLLVMIKSLIVLASWVCGYYAMKHLPLTIVGPVNATRPVMTLVGAVLIYGECLNAWQWSGVVLAFASLFMLSHSGKREGISFVHNRWVLLLCAAALTGAMSGLYDKFLMSAVDLGGVGLDRYFVQGWYNIYQAFIMTAVMAFVWWPNRKQGNPFRWRWSIVFISLFLTLADMAYFYALSCQGAMISVVSMVRRGSVVVSFLFGAIMFREANLRSKAFDLLWVMLGLLCLWIGSN